MKYINLILAMNPPLSIEVIEFYKGRINENFNTIAGLITVSVFTQETVAEIKARWPAVQVMGAWDIETGEQLEIPNGIHLNQAIWNGSLGIDKYARVFGQKARVI